MRQHVAVRVFEPGLAAPVLPGYAVTRLVGRGATSAVWAAVDHDTGAEVAVKVPDPTAYQLGELLHQAARETAVLDGVHCEHVVRLRRTLNLPDGGVALVLDLAEGGSLADLVAARGRLSEGEVATICTALATTLAALHDSGVIHGDLASGNVLFTPEGKPMIADFASARIVGESDPPLIAGTAGFVAPEVARGDIPTEASDAYGLGALAWFALTGTARNGEGQPDPLESVGFLGERMGPVVAPLLATEPQDRPGLLEAAAGFYGATTPVPVALLHGATDPATALTRRIRAQVSLAPEQESRPSRRWYAGRDPSGRHAASRGRRPGRLRGRRPRLRVRAAQRSRIEARKGRRSKRSRARSAVAVLLATAALFGLGRAIRLHMAEGRSDAPVAWSASGRTGGSTEPPGPTPEATPGPGELIRSDPRTVLASIADARAAALTAGDRQALERIEATDGPMLRSDSATLATLAAAGQSYAGLSFTVRSAEWVSGDERKALVHAVIDRSAYRVVGPDQHSQAHPAQPGGSYTYELTLVDGQWRLVTVA